MISCTDNAAELQREIARFAEEVRQGLAGVVQETCLDGAEHARQVGQYQDHSGANGLRASIHAWPVMRTVGGATGAFGTVKPYAAMVEGGTAAHEIRPRRVGALAFPGDDGETVFTRRVMHPGTAPRPFMGPAYIKAGAVLFARAELLCSRVIARHGGGHG